MRLPPGASRRQIFGFGAAALFAVAPFRHPHRHGAGPRISTVEIQWDNSPPAPAPVKATMRMHDGSVQVYKVEGAELFDGTELLELTLGKRTVSS